jgi:Thiamine biosynthesis ATP pyrophosphatase
MKLTALISGGIDSPVAAYIMCKMGAEVVLLHMDNRPFADDLSVEKVTKIAKQLRAITGKELPLYCVPHGLSQERISKTCDTNYQCVMCKRHMLKTAEQFNKSIQSQGVIMGDSLGQVASQTLKNIHAVSKGIGMPVMRPLIGYDKLEIESISKEIGVYDLSIIRSEGCRIVPSKPITEADVKKIEKFDLLSEIDDRCADIARSAIKL